MSPLPPVHLNSLRLIDFRNHAGVRLSFEKAFVVFAGENGAGKTNLLEAVSLLSPGRGLRRAVYADIARIGGSGGFSVSAELSSRENETHLQTVLRPDSLSARQVRIDETQAQSADELLDLLRVLWLTPAMDGLFTGPAADRRKFLDRMVLAVDPAHGRRAGDYEKAMRGRNRLLTENRRDEAWLAALETQMAELGIAIALARRTLVAMLAGMAAETPEGPFPLADLALTSGYEIEDLDRPAADLEDEAISRLANSRFEDRMAGRTREGPHRADLFVTHRAKAMPAALSSTGEQKALLVGLVLAHAQLVSRVSNLSPILLLDEIAAHLDPNRRAALFDILESQRLQAFMTGTDAELFEALGARADVFDVSSGGIALRASNPLPFAGERP